MLVAPPPHLGLRYVHGNRIHLAEQVEYEITGYDTTDCTITLHLVHDWRPGQKDAPSEDLTSSHSR